MKKYIFFFTLATLTSIFVVAQPELSWRFANVEVVNSGSQLQFDIEVKGDVPGSFHRDLQAYFDYNTVAFGSDVVDGTSITCTPLVLMENHYTVVNMVDNTSSKVAIITEGLNEGPTGGQPGSATYFNEVTTSYQGLLQITIDILDNTELAGIVFDEILMNGGQYAQSTSSTDPEKYADPCIYENDLIDQSLREVRLDLTLYMEGPYLGSSVMETFLADGSYIPGNQPYNPSLPYYSNSEPVWFYGGAETATPPADAVDWVLIQLRDADVAGNATSATILATQAGFLLSDGSVVDIDGTSNVSFGDLTISNNLFVVVYHRNHLGIMSANAVTQTAGIYTYDFSTGVDQVYGGIFGHKELETNIWGLVAGDGNGDGGVKNSDQVNVWLPTLNDPAGYHAGDYNLDNQPKNSDDVIWLLNLNVSGQVPITTNQNAGYSSQIPE